MHKLFSLGKFIPRCLFHFDASINKVVYSYPFWIVRCPGVFNSLVCLHWVWSSCHLVQALAVGFTFGPQLSVSCDLLYLPVSNFEAGIAHEFSSLIDPMDSAYLAFFLLWGWEWWFPGSVHLGPETINLSGSSCTFPVPALESTTSPKSPISF